MNNDTAATAASDSWALTEGQLSLMAEILASRTLLAATVPLRHPINGYPLGVLVIPAHTESGVPVPERRHEVTYHPGYGVCASSLTETNGSARIIVQCSWEGSYFESLSPINPTHIEEERVRILKIDKKSADSWKRIVTD